MNTAHDMTNELLACFVYTKLWSTHGEMPFVSHFKRSSQKMGPRWNYVSRWVLYRPLLDRLVICIIWSRCELVIIS